MNNDADAYLQLHVRLLIRNDLTAVDYSTVNSCVNIQRNTKKKKKKEMSRKQTEKKKRNRMQIEKLESNRQFSLGTN